MPRAKPDRSHALADQLRRAIDECGLTHYQLGQQSDTDPGLISRFMRRERDLRLESASRLCDTLGLRLGAAIQRTRSKPAKPARSPRASTAPEA